MTHRHLAWLQPRTDYVTDTPYGVLVSSPVVGVALYSADTTRREHRDGGNAGAEDAEEWGRRVCAFPRLRGKKTTSVTIVGTPLAQAVRRTGFRVKKHSLGPFDSALFELWRG